MSSSEILGSLESLWPEELPAAIAHMLANGVEQEGYDVHFYGIGGGECGTEPSDVVGISFTDHAGPTHYHLTVRVLGLSVLHV